VDLQTRRLRYFVAVAEELHFSRTATRLHIAQQALSKQIRELEDALGAQLLERNTRNVKLTPAGAAFLAAARAALAALDDGVEAALPRGHALAQRDGVSVRELVQEPIAMRETDDAAVQAFWTLEAYRDPGVTGRIVAAHSVTEELSLVAAGLACAITSAASARYTPHPSVRYVPIDDGPGAELSVAWRDDAENALVDRFLEAARAVRERETELVRAIEHPELG
jgi:DNA-binding transcriptional LysR family regulator